MSRLFRRRVGTHGFTGIESLERRALLSATPIVSGQTISGSIAPGESDSFTFNGNVGDSVIIAYGKTANSDYYAAASALLFAPDGTTVSAVGDYGSTSGVTLAKRLTLSGTYTIVAKESSSDNFMNYHVTLAKAPSAQADPQGGKITAGTTRSGTINPGDIDVYTFAASKGDHAIIGLGKTGGDYYAATSLVLYAPDGTILQNPVGDYGSSSGVTVDQALSANGTYTIVAKDSSSDNAYTYNLSLGGVLHTPDSVAPKAVAKGSVTTAGTKPAIITVTWTDETAMNASTIGSGDIIVTGPSGSGYKQVGSLVAIDSNNGKSIVARYSVPAPPSGWTAAANGAYSVQNRLNQVADAAGNVMLVQFIGPMTVSIPVTTKSSLLAAPNPGTNTSTVFTWSVVSTPSGATKPTFSRNSTNSAKTTTITFFKTGTYTLKLTQKTGTTVQSFSFSVLVKSLL